MRFVFASLLFAAVVCLSFADDAAAPKDSQPGVEVVENAGVESSDIRIKRHDSDEKIKLKIDEHHYGRHHGHHRHHHHHHHHSKESCSDESVKIKVDVESDESCSDNRHHHHHHHRHHHKDSCSDEEETVKIKLDVDSEESCSHEHSRHHHHYHKNSCSDEDETVKIKVDVDSEESCSDEHSRHHHKNHHHHVHSNSPQIHYHHHNTPVAEVVRYNKGEYASVEGGNRHYGADKYSYEQNRNGHHFEHQTYQSSEEEDYPKQGYNNQNRYGVHGRHRSEERGYQNNGGYYGKRDEGTIVCDSDETITILV